MLKYFRGLVVAGTSDESHPLGSGKPSLRAVESFWPRSAVLRLDCTTCYYSLLKIFRVINFRGLSQYLSNEVISIYNIKMTIKLLHSASYKFKRDPSYSEALCLRCLALQPKCPWATHCFSHVVKESMDPLLRTRKDWEDSAWTCNW